MLQDQEILGDFWEWLESYEEGVGNLPGRHALDAERPEADLDALVEPCDQLVDTLQVVLVIARMVGTGEPAAVAWQHTRIELLITTCKQNKRTHKTVTS